MLLKFQKVAVSDLLKQRNFAYVVCVFFMIMNAVFAVCFLKKSNHVVIIPSLSEPQKSYSIDGKHISDNYYVDWAYQHLGNLFTVNPLSFAYKKKTFLQWSLSAARLEDDLDKLFSLLKKDRVSTAFYPESYVLHRKKKEIEVRGRFLTYFGKSNNPVLRERTFVMGWKVLSNGMTAISSLKEITDEN